MTKKKAPGDIKPSGRPTKFRHEFSKQSRKLAKLGATETEIADFLEIDATTLMRWKADHPTFCRALTPGKAAADKRVEVSLYHRATGYSHPETHIAVVKGKIVKTELVRHYPPAEGAIKLWLTNRQPRKWRDIKSATITTPPGQPMEHKLTYGSPELLADFYGRSAPEVFESAVPRGGEDLGDGEQGRDEPPGD